MRYSKLTQLMLAAVFGAFGTQMAGAAPTAEEAAQLGKTLTPFGAIKAGNKEGTIPEWTGGMCKPPAGYKPLRTGPDGEPSGGPWVDPFADEKPILKITAANVAQYADKLNDGEKELLRRYPQTYFINVYPSHRTACFPNYMYENTIKRVMNPKVVSMDVAPSLVGAHAQIPFPIPKTGVEAMWNFMMKPEPTLDMLFDTWLSDSSGNIVFQNTQNTRMTKWFWDNSVDKLPDNKPYFALMSRVIAPAQQVGTNQLRIYYQRHDTQGTTTYSYIPGQRRVRIAPDFSYDGVSTTSGGILLFDEINGFDGKMDRFDFKLIGRKEMYILYNPYLYMNSPVKDVSMPFHANPNAQRYELHRVWVVEATLKPGERHVQKKKIFYFDEDSWNTNSFVGIDQADKIHHYIVWPIFQSYDKPEIRISDYYLYDFTKRMYTTAKYTQDKQGRTMGYWKVKPYPANFFTPDSMAGSGVR